MKISIDRRSVISIGFDYDPEADDELYSVFVMVVKVFKIQDDKVSQSIWKAIKGWWESHPRKGEVMMFVLDKNEGVDFDDIFKCGFKFDMSEYLEFVEGLNKSYEEACSKSNLRIVE